MIGVIKELPGKSLDQGEAFFVIAEELNFLLMSEMVLSTLR